MSTREELFIYGYMKQWHKLNNIELPPDDIILSFVSWIKLFDSFDKEYCHSEIKFHPVIATKFQVDHGSYPTAIGWFIIEKGMKQSWTFSIKQRSACIGIMDEDIIQKSGKNIEDFVGNI